MPVVVAEAGRDQRNRGSHRGREPRVLVHRPVMRHLEHVGAQIQAGGEQGRLGRRFDVAGEQNPDSAHLGERDNAGVVRTRPLVGSFRKRAWPGGGRGHGRKRPDQVQPQLPKHPHRAGGAGPNRSVHLRGSLLHLTDRGPGLGERAHQDLVDRAPGQHTGQPVDVVGVEMGQDEHRDPAHAQPIQAASDRACVGPGIDHHRRSRTHGQRKRVALTDIAGDDDPSRWRPAGRTDRVHPAEHQHHTTDHGTGRQPAPDQRRTHRDHQGEGGQHKQAAGRTRAPRQDRTRNVRRCPRDPDDPTGRPARERADHGGDRLHGVHGQRRGQTEDRGGRHRGSGQQIGRQRHQADLPGDHHDDWQRGDLGGRGQRQRLGERTPTQLRTGQPRRDPIPPTRTENQHPGRGKHGKREPVRPRQPRIDEQQHEDGRSECRQPGPAPPTRQRHEQDRRHHRGPQHTRLGTGEHHESEHGGESDCGRGPAGAPERSHQTNHDARGDREIRAGDRGQMTEPRLPEVLDQVVRHSGGVTDRECRDQAARRRIETIDGLAQTRPQPGRHCLDRRLGPDHGRRAPWAQHGRRAVQPARLGQSAGDADPLAGHEAQPLLGCRRQDQHWQPDPGLRRPAEQELGTGRHQCGRPGPDRTVGPGLDPGRIASDRKVEGCGLPPASEIHHRPVLGGRDPRRRGHRDRSTGQAHRGNGCPRSGSCPPQRQHAYSSQAGRCEHGDAGSDHRCQPSDHPGRHRRQRKPHIDRALRRRRHQAVRGRCRGSSAAALSHLRPAPCRPAPGSARRRCR